jgi:hypothetical protein
MKDKSPTALHVLPGRLIGGNFIPSRTGWQASRPHILIFFLVQHPLIGLSVCCGAPIPSLRLLVLTWSCLMGLSLVQSSQAFLLCRKLAAWEHWLAWWEWIVRLLSGTHSCTVLPSGGLVTATRLVVAERAAWHMNERAFTDRDHRDVFGSFSRCWPVVFVTAGQRCITPFPSCMPTGSLHAGSFCLPCVRM